MMKFVVCFSVLTVRLPGISEPALVKWPKTRPPGIGNESWQGVEKTNNGGNTRRGPPGSCQGPG